MYSDAFEYLGTVRNGQECKSGTFRVYNKNVRKAFGAQSPQHLSLLTSFNIFRINMLEISGYIGRRSNA